MDDTPERVFINIQQKPPSPDKFCREVRMSMLIFLPVTEENLSFRGKVPLRPPSSPMVTVLPSKRPFCVSGLQSDTEEHLRIRPTQHLGAVLISTQGWGVGGGILSSPISSVIVLPVFLMAACKKKEEDWAPDKGSGPPPHNFI